MLSNFLASAMQITDNAILNFNDFKDKYFDDLDDAKLPPQASQEFTAGFLYGASNGQLDRRQNILDCMTDEKKVINKLRKAFVDYNNGKI